MAPRPSPDVGSTSVIEPLGYKQLIIFKLET